jgi:4-amino-4-deoxy-L-arabinose transferase-like glycosyltransferase
MVARQRWWEKLFFHTEDSEKLFWCIAGGLFLFHLLYIWLTPFDLAPDEAYYWDWSRHLALGYYSKPPMVAWVIAFFTQLGGDYPFFVRVGATLFSLGSTVVLFYLGRALFNARVGLWAMLIANATPGFAVGSVIMTIDPLVIFFWGLTIFLLQRALCGEKKRYWYLAGISLGLGLLSKYTIVALVPSLFLYLAFSPTKRSWLKKKELYLFILIGLLIISPTLYWNYTNQWTSVTQPAGLVDDRNLSGLTTFFWFFGPQTGILSPLTFLLVLYGLWQGGRRGIADRDDRYSFLFWHAMPLFGFFLILSFFSVCYVNWAAPAYFTAFILAVAVVWEHKGWRTTVKKRVLLWALLIGVITCSSLFTMDTARKGAVTAVDLWADITGAKISGAKIIPAEKFPSNRLRGWQELGTAVTELLNKVGRERTFLVSYKRDYVSELAFYVKGHPTVYLVNLSGRIESQYDLWEGFEDKVGFNALYVTKLDRRPPESFAKAFDRVAEIKTVKIYAGTEFIQGYSIFYCQGFRGLKGL